MGRNTVLVVHSDRAVRESVRYALESAAYVVRTSDASDTLAVEDADLVLLEWLGSERTAALLGSGRANGPRPERVIVMAAATAFPEAISALSLGAADCLRLPFDDRELVARAGAVLKRPYAGTPHETVAVGPIVLDRSAHRVAIEGQAVALSPAEFRLLAFFLEHPERVFARIELLRRAWSKDLKPRQQRTVDVHVRRLRRVLEPFGCEEMIQTVRGFGYRFSSRSMRSGANGRKKSSDGRQQRGRRRPAPASRPASRRLGDA